jgi:hypothetical protein
MWKLQDSGGTVRSLDARADIVLVEKWKTVEKVECLGDGGLIRGSGLCSSYVGHSFFPVWLLLLLSFLHYRRSKSVRYLRAIPRARTTTF